MAAPEPPVAPRRPHPLTAHGRTRQDDWYWLRDASDPDVTRYLEAENRYGEEILGPTAALQEALFQEIKARVHETDAGPPARRGGWWYYARTEEGKQYPILCRLPDPERALEAAVVATAARAGRPPDEEVVLDQNGLAEPDGYLAVGVFDVSPDHATLAYALDLDGSERYTLRFRDLATGGDHPDVIERVYYGSAWAADNETFFYVRPDQAMRPWQVWRHLVGTPARRDVLVFQEDDERFFVSVGRSRSGRRVVIESASRTTSDARWLDADRPEQPPTLVLAREPGVEYDVEHDGRTWLVRTNRPGPDGTPATNFALYRLEEDRHDATDLEPVIGHRPDVKLESVDAFAGFAAVTERSATDGLERIRILDPSGDHLVEQPEPVYCLLEGQNPDWEQETYRFAYTSLVTPRTSVDYHPGRRERVEVWSQLVGGGYDRRRYRTERAWARAADGTEIPLSIVGRKDQPLDGSAPGLLYGYGAYEASIDPTFSVFNLNLIERGAVFAIAHIRGGGELGRAWYEQGRLDHKTNTFTDFIAGAEALVAGGWVRPDALVARGASAGGLLMGAVTNLRPDLWRAVVAEVPFVDVVTTMSDPTLPLTVTEWEEWGDPVHDEAAFERMLSYSPYDNVEPRPRYPALFVTAGLNDPRVSFWEPAKWVAKLRSVGAGADDRPVILRTEMGAGHQGPSGRYDSWRDEARVQAFVLTQMGLA